MVLVVYYPGVCNRLTVDPLVTEVMKEWSLVKQRMFYQLTYPLLSPLITYVSTQIITFYVSTVRFVTSRISVDSYVHIRIVVPLRVAQGRPIEFACQSKRRYLIKRFYLSSTQCNQVTITPINEIRVFISYIKDNLRSYNYLQV